MRTRLAFSLLFAVLLLSVCSVAGADVFDSPAWQQEMDLVVVDSRLGLILTQVIDPTGTDYSLDRDLEWVMLPSLTVKGTPRRSVLDFVLKACGLTYRMDGDKIVVVAKEGYKNAWLTHVNIDLKDVALGRAVDCLFRGNGINYTIDPDAVNLPVARWVCMDVTLYQAFETLMKSAGAVSSESMGVVHIAPASKSTPALAVVPEASQLDVTVEPGDGDPWARRTNIDVKDAQLGRVVEKLLKDTGFNFSISEDAVYLAVRALKLDGVTLRKAFDALIKQAGAVCIDGKGVLSITPKSPLPEPKDLLCLNLKDVPLPEALESLFRGTGRNYTLESDIGGLRVTASLENVPFHSVLKTLLDSGGLTYRIDGRMYHIYAIPQATTDTKPKLIQLKWEIYTKVDPAWNSEAIPDCKPGAYCAVSVDKQSSVREALTASGAELANSLTITTLNNTRAEMRMKTTINMLPRINADNSVTLSIDVKPASVETSISQRLANGESLLWIMPDGTQTALMITPTIVDQRSKLSHQ